MKTQTNLKTWMLTSTLLLTTLQGIVLGIGGDMGLSTEPLTDGSSDYPWLIEDLDDFNVFAGSSAYWASGVYTRLETNIDLSTQSYTTAVIAPGGTGGFSGIFDGNDHVISNLTIDDGGLGNDRLGLFGFVDIGGKLKNLGMENVSITGSDNSDYLGGLCGWNYGGTIRNCYAIITVTGGTNNSHSIGGLCGESTSGIITDCYVTGAVTGGTGTIGGLCGGISDAGQDQFGSITNCYAAVTVTGGDDSQWLGGLVGSNPGAIINDCSATGSVTGGNNSEYLGGLNGDNYSSNITNCYATGSVTGGDGSSFLGGLNGGFSSETLFTNCYATGSVTGGDGSSFLGGFVGYSLGTYTACFWNSEINPLLTGSGDSTDPLGIMGRTTTQMQDPNTFITNGWDFVSESANGRGNHWRLCVDGIKYPELAWQSITADLACPDGVDLSDFAYFASRWLETDCDTKNSCGRADMDVSTDVGLPDLLFLTDNWLAGK